MRYQHSHAINIIEHTSKYLALLVFPAIRALFIGNIGLYAWLQGAWFDILTVMIIILLGFWAWYKYVYKLTDEGIYIKQGIILPKYRYIPYQKLSVVYVERPFYLIPFKAVRINADTDGGYPTTPDFAITVYKRQVEGIVKLVNAPFINQAEIKRVYLPKNFYIAVLSFVASNSLTGVIFASTFISGTGKVLGSEFENQVVEQITSVASFIAVGVPPIAAILGFTILGGWAVSFISNLIRHLRFCATRQSSNLFIQSGLFTRREYYIAVNRINLIELRQTLLTKLFGFYTAFIHSNGYGKRKDELSVLMPSGEGSEIVQNMKLLLPEIPISKPKLKSRLKFLSRFLIPPVWCVIIASVLWLVEYLLFPDFSDIILYIGIMTELPCLWYLCVKIISYFHTGVGVSETAYTLCYTYGYRIKTVAVPKNRIVKLTIRRSMFQIMSGCCDLVILTYSEGKKRHVVPNLDFEEAQRVMGATKYYSK
ncbi:MAG: PH domain-containing protein [Oscillospiraceae bacterium]